MGITSQIKKFFPRFIGKLAVAYGVKRFAGGSSWGGSTSELAGGAWGWQQYATAVIIAMWGPKLLGRFVPAGEFSEGAWDLILTKAIWTEGIARSDWAKEQFGVTGDVQYNKATGQMMIDQGGQYVNMQGGQLVQAGPLDGFGALEDGPMLGGQLVQAGPLDGPYLDDQGVAGPGLGSPYSSESVYG